MSANRSTSRPPATRTEVSSAAKARPTPFRVLIAGGGVAALETVLALRALAEERVELELLAPEPHFWYRPLAVVEPFGGGRVHGVELVELAAKVGAQFTLGALAVVEPAEHLARTAVGAEIEYDVLVVASGARPVPAIEGAFTFRGPADSDAFGKLLVELGSGMFGRLAFAVPGGVTWSLPLYELALMTAKFAEERGMAAELTVVTPEDAPLALFGAEASSAVADLLRQRGVTIRTGTYPLAVAKGRLEVTPGEAIAADRVVALARIDGAPITGLPHDAGGFIPTGAQGRVKGVDDVYAAGDVTAFPVKQGGLAAAQADAVAEAIAAAAGADVVPQPFRPILRGLVLTGAVPTFLRAELAGGYGETSVASREPLWWPPGKVAGKHLAPFLADWAGLVLAPVETAEGVVVDLDLGRITTGTEVDRRGSRAAQDRRGT
jgi:sulfide:quinone oxidoreductase